LYERGAIVERREEGEKIILTVSLSGRNWGQFEKQFGSLVEII
jgi:hypothetical protein